MVIIVLFVLGGPMVVFSIILREVIPDDGPPPSSLLLPAAALAYYVALSWVRFIETIAVGSRQHVCSAQRSCTCLSLQQYFWHCSCTSYAHIRFSGRQSRSAQPLCYSQTASGHGNSKLIMGLGAMTWRRVAANQQLHHRKVAVRRRGAEKTMIAST